VLLTLMKTGSRGALVAVTVGLAILFLRSSVAGKLRIVVAGLIGLLLVAALMPRTLLTRYQTLFDSREEAAVGEEAHSIESASTSLESRRQLLLHSLELTWRHPLLGVGPGMFRVAEDALARSKGARRGAWLETHNSYTQISSEVGIPALILYVAALFAGLRATGRIYRQARARAGLEQTANMALGLNFSLAMFMVTSLFSSVAYHSMITVLSGFTVALLRLWETQNQSQAISIPAAPAQLRRAPALRAS
jgi:O-antigen ligase